MGISTTSEVALPGTDRRLDLVEHQRHPHGKHTGYDFTVGSPDAVDHAARASRQQGYVADHLGQLKRKKYDVVCKEHGFDFVPLAMEESGYMSKELFALFHFCGGRERDFPEAVPEFTTFAAPDHLSYWCQRLSLAIVRGQAEMHRAALHRLLKSRK